MSENIKVVYGKRGVADGPTAASSGRSAHTPFAQPTLSDEQQQVLWQMQQLAWLMDDAITIPGLRWRIGLDGLVGLLPGFGDLVTAGISGFIIRQAAALGVPNVILLRMAFNTAVDVVVGAIPFVGDIFDFAWKANRKNLQLVISYLEAPAKTERMSWFTAIGLIAAIVGSASLFMLLIIAAISALF